MKVTIGNANYHAQYAARMKEIVRIIGERPGVNRVQLSEMLQITQAAMKRPLMMLCEGEEIMQEIRQAGLARTCFYYLPKDAPESAYFKKPRKAILKPDVSLPKPTSPSQFDDSALAELLRDCVIAAQHAASRIPSSYVHTLLETGGAR